MAVAPWIVSEELWSRIEPLLPKVERRFRYPGRKRLPDRQALQGILFVLYTGIAWRHLPPELGFGGGSTCHRRMDEWQRVGVWEQLAGCCWRSCTLPASSSGRVRWPTPVLKKKKKKSANRNDVTQLLPLVDGIGTIVGKPGRPRQRPDRVIADRGYDHDKYRRQLWARGVKPIIARRQTEHGSGRGRWRWVVERTFAWPHNFRRLRARFTNRGRWPTIRDRPLEQ